MNFKGGVIIIGSLFWEKSSKRIKWRELYLKLIDNKIPVKVRIRYGRESSTRKKTFTMIFSNHSSTAFGQAMILPLKESIKNARILEKQAFALASAEGLWKNSGASLNKSWGTVGLLINPNIEVSRSLEIIKERWTKIYQEYKFDNTDYTIDNEPAIIDKNGFLKMDWTDEMNEFDFLIATLTVPKPKALLNAKDIYDRMNESGYNEYFINNQKHNILTFQDEEIISGLKK